MSYAQPNDMNDGDFCPKCLYQLNLSSYLSSCRRSLRFENLRRLFLFWPELLEFWPELIEFRPKSAPLCRPSMRFLPRYARRLKPVGQRGGCATCADCLPVGSWLLRCRSSFLSKKKKKLQENLVVSEKVCTFAPANARKHCMKQGSGFSAVGSAHVWGARGRWFESSNPDKRYSKPLVCSGLVFLYLKWSQKTLWESQANHH